MIKVAIILIIILIQNPIINSILKKFIDVFDSPIHKPVINDKTGKSDVKKITIALPDTGSAPNSIFSNDNFENPILENLYIDTQYKYPPSNIIILMINY